MTNDTDIPDEADQGGNLQLIQRLEAQLVRDDHGALVEPLAASAVCRPICHGPAGVAARPGRGRVPQPGRDRRDAALQAR